MRSKNDFATTEMLRWFVLATFFTAAASAAAEVCVQPNSTLPSGSTVLKSPVLEEFGAWGKWDECPKGTFFSGVQLKVDAGRPKYNTIPPYKDHYDNTGLNGVQFLCSKVGENQFPPKRPTSAVGHYGEWLAPLFCDFGVINGFQVRHAIYVNNTSIKAVKNRVDNMGAVNLRIHCVKTENRMLWLEGSVRDPQDAFPESPNYRNQRVWVENQFCGAGQALTAVRTQVDLRKKVNSKDAAETNDVRGLINIEMRCDHIKTPLETCEPKLFYQQILECNNIKGAGPLSCRYETKVGTQSSQANRKTESNMRSILGSLGVSAEVKVAGFYTKMNAMISAGVDNGDTSINETSQFWDGETISGATVTVEANRVQRIFQVLGSCGDTEVRTSRIIVDERIGDVPNPMPKTGFVCTDPRKVPGGKTRKLPAVKHFQRSDKTNTKDEF